MSISHATSLFNSFFSSMHGTSKQSMVVRSSTHGNSTVETHFWREPNPDFPTRIFQRAWLFPPLIRLRYRRYSSDIVMNYDIYINEWSKVVTRVWVKSCDACEEIFAFWCESGNRLTVIHTRNIVHTRAKHSPFSFVVEIIRGLWPISGRHPRETQYFAADIVGRMKKHN